MAQAGKIPGSKRALRERKKRLGREGRFGSMTPRRRYLIACEGKETEPNYFNELKQILPRNIAVIADGDGRNTLSLVKWTEEEERKYEQNGEHIDEVWVVMDRDSFPPHDFDNAINKVKAKDKKSVKEALAAKKSKKDAKRYRAAWSNECFELWILLHFQDVTHPLARDEIYHKLSDIFECNYEKQLKAENLYSLLRKQDGDEAEAITRAEKLWESKEPVPSRANPATGVFELVRRLNAHRKSTS
ncbi:MAG: RloB family protein [Lentisphaeria bacterium]|nr:RloB family protein [Lentisphaeria bacterium]